MEKAGRNDPCPCGSGKKYKQCCLLQQQKEATPPAPRKFTAKIISSGGMPKPEVQSPQEQQRQAAVDYNTLMERSFGPALASDESAPPLPDNPFKYMIKEEERT